MELKQIKAFNKKTVTQEIAAEICAIACWNHLNEDRFKNQFVITDATPKGILKTGGGSIYPWDESKSDRYIKTATGIHIKTPIRMKARIFEKGEVIVTYLKEKNNPYKTVKIHKESGAEREIIVPGHMNFQINLVDYYLKAGFYTVKNK